MKKIVLIFFYIFFIISCTNNQIVSETKIPEELVKKEKIILSLWDSLTAWYWVDLVDNYPSKLEKKLTDLWYNYKVINSWVSGDTSSSLKSRVSLYLDKNPEIIILVIWWNDWLRWLSTVDLKENIKAIIDAFPKDTKIVLWWMDIPINLGFKYRSDFKKVYEEISKENKDIYFFKSFLDWVMGDYKLNISDRIHPNPLWYDIIVWNLYDFLEKNKILEK